MIEKHFMTEKVFLADIKLVPLQMLPARLWRKMADFVAEYVAENGGFCRTMWRKMADYDVVKMVNAPNTLLPI